MPFLSMSAGMAQLAGWLDWICLTTTHVLQDILAVLHKWMGLRIVSFSKQLLKSDHIVQSGG